MQMQIPGTALSGTREDLMGIGEKLDALFLAGDMTRGQVVTITGLEPYMVQNWVKRGFLAPPVNKRYSKRQLCRMLNINALRAALPMDGICGLLTYVNGQLDDESDDLIDDTDLYIMFVRLAACEGENTGLSRKKAIEKELAAYGEVVPGSRERIARVLEVMLTAWEGAQLRAQAEKLLKTLSEKE